MRILKSQVMPRPLALTLGEPAGIGPDITFAAWRRRVDFAADERLGNQLRIVVQFD